MKDCPFCGSETYDNDVRDSIVGDRDNTACAFVGCSICGCEGPLLIASDKEALESLRQRAIAAWNNRHC